MSNKVTTIPKRMCFFWAGGKMSWLRYLTLQTFCLHNPSWETTLYVSRNSKSKKSWTSEEQQDFCGYDGPDWMHDAYNLPITVKAVDLPENLDPVHQCDMYQWKVLHEHGGWYSDMDILYMHPMDDLLHKCASSDLVAPLPCGDFTIGFLGCKPGLKFFELMYNSCKDGGEPSQYQDFGTNRICQILKIRPHSPGHFMAQRIMERYNHRLFTPSPGEDVYPWNWRGIEQIWEWSHELPPSQVGIHWFAGSPISQKYNNWLTPKNWKEHPCTFTRHLQERSKIPGIWEPENSRS